MLHSGMYDELVHTQHIEELNIAVLKNYHSHDHCLLSKWKRATCTETTSMQHANAVLKKVLPSMGKRMFDS